MYYSIFEYCIGYYTINVWHAHRSKASKKEAAEKTEISGSY
jgi:hypothetical protein